MSPITSAIRIVWRALGDVWGDLWTALIIDFIWLLSILLIIPGPPATLALFSLANRQVHDEPFSVRDFWWALGEYWKPGWRWGIINLVVLFFLIGDVYLSGRGTMTPLTRFIQSFYITCIAIWSLLQLFALAFLIEQEEPSVRMALRNAMVMLGRNPVFSVCLGISLLLIWLIGIVGFLLTLGFGEMFLASAANRAVADQLAKNRGLEQA